MFGEQWVGNMSLVSMGRFTFRVYTGAKMIEDAHPIQDLFHIFPSVQYNDMRILLTKGLQVMTEC
jgi:hypothetical protein